jgi:hypothetical protein
MRSALPALLLGAVAIGCGGPAVPDKPIDPSLSNVTIEVNGMT